MFVIALLLTVVDFAAHALYMWLSAAFAIVAFPAMVILRFLSRAQRRLYAKRLSPENNVYVVTGAASGFGRELSVRLVLQGGIVLACDVNEAGLKDVAAALSSSPGQFHYKVANLAIAADCARFTRFVREFCEGRPDGCLAALINNAGIFTPILSGVEFSDAVVDKVFAVNVLGLIRITRGCYPVLKKSRDARIINVSSMAAYGAAQGFSLYSASKFAVEGFSEALLGELPAHVRVIPINPSFARTNIFSSADKIASEEEITSSEIFSAKRQKVIGMIKKLSSGFTFNSTFKDWIASMLVMPVERVVDDIEDAVLSTIPKERYIVCPALPLLFMILLCHMPNYFGMKTKLLSRKH
eukprot:PhM_4_TR5330/c0_g1_i1/m.77803